MGRHFAGARCNWVGFSRCSGSRELVQNQKLCPGHPTLGHQPVPLPTGCSQPPLCRGKLAGAKGGIRQPNARPAYLFTSLALQWRLTEVSTLWFILSVIVRLYPAIWHSDLLGVYYPLLIRLLLSNSETQSSARVLSLFFRRATFKTWCRLNF